MINNNTIRDIMKDRIREVLSNYFYNVDVLEVDADLVATLADEAFSICGISEKEQDTKWQW